MPPTPTPEQTREQLIDELRGLLQPASAEPLTREDARGCLDDLVFLGTWLLESWRQMPILPPRPAVRRDPSAPPPPPPEAQAGPDRAEAEGRAEALVRLRAALGCWGDEDEDAEDHLGGDAP